MSEFQPKVSVGVMTYNQAPFIRQTLESALSQKTSFPFEIIVHDDCSTDGTREIVQRFVRDYPDRVRAILQEENQFSQGRRILQILLPELRGEYIALLDGDDYWQSESKLQKQADFMDRNPGCALCQPKTVYYSEADRRPVMIFPAPSKRVSGLTCSDLAERNFIQTSGVMFRSAALPVLPTEFGRLKFGDYPLFALIAQAGWIGFLNEEMVTYRVHGENFWLGKSVAERIDATMEVVRFVAGHIDPLFRNSWVQAARASSPSLRQRIRDKWDLLAQRVEILLR